MRNRPLWHYVLTFGIAGLVLLLVFSAPFNARAKALFRETTQWTPERIRSRPAEYLGWALEQSAATRNELETHRLALLARRHALRQAELEARARHAAAVNLLADAKVKYRQASADDSWPVQIEDTSLPKEEFQRRIVNLHRSCQRHFRLAEEHGKLQPLVALRLDQVAERIAEVDDLQARLSATVELVGLSRSVDDCRRLHGVVSDILHMNNAVGEVTKSPGIESILDDQSHLDNFARDFAAIIQE